MFPHIDDIQVHDIMLLLLVHSASRCNGEVMGGRRSLKGDTEIVCNGEVATPETHPDIATVLEVLIANVLCRYVHVHTHVMFLWIMIIVDRTH